MKKINKILSVALVAVMVCTTLVGCGNSGSTASGDVFKIGGIGPTTGDAATYGTAVKNGIQIAVDEINEAGGINGYQIEYKFEDDENDAEKSVNAYNVLKDWGMQMLVGSTTSGCSVAVAAESANDNMFQLTPSGSSTNCTANANVFRVCFSDPDQGKASANFIASNKLATKIAVIYDSSSEYSSGIFASFAQQAAENNLEITSSAFTSDNKTDFSVQLQSAKENGAELVFLPIYYQEASAILSQADTMGFDPLWFGCDGLDGILTGVENWDTELAEGVMLLTPFAADAKDDLTQNFVRKYVDAYGETPNQFAADAYDAVYAIKAAAEAANLKPDMSISDMCEAMKTAMTTISINGLTGADMTWTADGEPNKGPKAVEIVDGKYVLKE
mgnify:FL=1